MKFQPGINTFRIFGKPLMGNEIWVIEDDGKKRPVRVPMGTEFLPEDLKKAEKDKEGNVVKKHFWAVVVWNYKEQSVQVLEITQKSIIKSLLSFAENPKWGNPNGYDISVTKNGSGMETEYLTDHDPKEELPVDIKKKLEATSINLEALFSGDDPFKTESFEEFLEKAEAEKEAE